ncbi:MAG: threonine ammonia-lyase [Firmicutes bacterium]|nr:threonine ammonia-lyase [Bacillota bacterium]
MDLTLDMIYHAAFVLKNTVRKTDIIRAPRLSDSCNVYLKTENLQNTGSFKLRGAAYKISQLTDEEKGRGIIACSAGNHAQGVAMASTKNGIRATICMPDSAPISKVEATRRLGAEVILVPGGYDAAAERAEQLVEKTGATFIHPFNDEQVMAGQGTIGLEILDQLDTVDAIVVPVGGGGLISGVAYAVKNLNPEVKIYGVQAAGSASMVESLKAGEALVLDSASTFADGIAVKCPGDKTLELTRKYVDEVVTVTEDEIATAILALIEKQKLIAEGAGAVSVAAVMFDKVPVKGKNVVCLVSGGNIDVNILSRVITRGLVKSGRNVNLTIALEDKPGQLEAVSRIVADCGGNVVSVQYDRGDVNMAITSCFLKLALETKGAEQIVQIREKLEEEGFRIVP